MGVLEIVGTKRPKTVESASLVATYPIESLAGELAQACNRAFLRFLRRCRLHLSTPDGSAVYVDVAILKRYSRATAGGMHFVYLTDPMFMMDAQNVLDLAGAAKRLEGHLADLGLPNPARAQLAERSARASTAHAFLRYQGALLAIPSDEEPTLEDIGRAYGCSTLATATPSKRRRGRPDKQAQAASAYHELFPNGHGQLSWKEVVRVIGREKGTHVSVDTLQRGLKGTAKPAE